MKINAINKTETNYKGFKINHKATNLAYSSIFTLTLLSSFANLANNQGKDTFKKSNGTQNSQELTYTQKSPVIKAQQIYTDNYNNKWVMLQEYHALRNESYQTFKDIYNLRELINNRIKGMEETSQNIQKMQNSINEVNTNYPQLEAKANYLEQQYKDLYDTNSILSDSKPDATIVGVVLGLITGLIVKLGYNLLNKSGKGLINKAKQYFKL